eukprot:GHVQ01023772.1.p1 GENE.GHVQ01023772.1~~GHVQ01023772.1.p1  ORF type:complete len:178 (+),score=2.89 GHVQ01023772.1:357-890(+)
MVTEAGAFESYVCPEGRGVNPPSSSATSSVRCAVCWSLLRKGTECVSRRRKCPATYYWKAQVCDIPTLEILSLLCSREGRFGFPCDRVIPALSCLAIQSAILCSIEYHQQRIELLGGHIEGARVQHSQESCSRQHLDMYLLHIPQQERSVDSSETRGAEGQNLQLTAVAITTRCSSY